MILSEDFICQMRALLGDDADAFLQSAAQTDATVSIRLNRRKNLKNPDEASFSVYACENVPASVSNENASALSGTLAGYVSERPLSAASFENVSLLEKASPVPWCPLGYYLSQRPSFTLDPLFHAGAYYVQEASSMFLWTAVRQALQVMDLENKPLIVLDLCAAPGGKSTLLLDILPEGSVLVANEIVHSRANILAENLTKWGSPNVIVTEAKPEDLDGLYDLILTDVPCSGEGMFRKDEQAVAHWNPVNVAMCAERQRDIMQAIWPRLRPGGCLIYSTCTFNTQENEENVAWIASTLGAEPVYVDTQALLGKSYEELGIVSALFSSCPFTLSEIDSNQVSDDYVSRWLAGKASRRMSGNGISFSEDREELRLVSWPERLPVARFMFHRSRGEGLFMALLQKDASSENDDAAVLNGRAKNAKPNAKSNAKSSFNIVKMPPFAAACLRHPEDYTCVEIAGRIHAMTPDVLALYETLSKRKLRMHLAGICLGEIKGKDFVPDTALALSTAIDYDFSACRSESALVSSASTSVSASEAVSDTASASDSAEKTLPIANIDKATALSYLRREAIVLDASVPKGYVLLCHQHLPIGWVKNLGNRANNLYPNEWRIRNV